MKTTKRVFAILTIVCLAFNITASAAASAVEAPTTISSVNAGVVTVKYNGGAVTFPDAQPFVDANSRTMMPLRAVTETMGAAVSWDNNTETAIIAQNGITVKAQIGNENLTVIKGETSSVVKMDTKAVLSNDRTYVPIRFVAEALEAWVGYSDMYNTVQIYRDVLTPKEISRLHGYYDMTYAEYCKSRNIADGGLTDAKRLSIYPFLSNFVGQNGFENANEYKLNNPNMVPTKYTGMVTGMTYTTASTSGLNFAKLILAEANGITKSVNATGKLTFSFKSDLSCVYWSRSSNEAVATVRGILTITVPANADIAWIKNTYGGIISDPKSGETRNVDVEIRVATNKSDGKVYWSYMDALK